MGAPAKGPLLPFRPDARDSQDGLDFGGGGSGAGARVEPGEGETVLVMVWEWDAGAVELDDGISEAGRAISAYVGDRGVGRSAARWATKRGCAAGSCLNAFSRSSV